MVHMSDKHEEYRSAPGHTCESVLLDPLSDGFSVRLLLSSSPPAAEAFNSSSEYITLPGLGRGGDLVKLKS